MADLLGTNTDDAIGHDPIEFYVGNCVQCQAERPIALTFEGNRNER